MADSSIWLTGAATVQGPGHIKYNLPNQDNFTVRVNHDGRVIAAVVSDGAGSAPHSAQGSRVCVEVMGEVLLGLAVKHPEQIEAALRKESAALQFIQERITAGLQYVRKKLDPTEKELQQFHHTFSGVVLTPEGGFITQIGDSPGITTRWAMVKSEGGPDRVDFFARHRIHLTEKGEYVNETCFVTQPGWRQTLSCDLIHPGEALLLMSDGAGDLVTSRGEIFRPFINNLFSRMLKEQGSIARDQIVHDALSDPRADEITADDKTLLLICPREWQRLATFPCFEPDLAEPKSLPGPPPAPLPGPTATPPVPRPTPQPGFSLNVLVSIALVASLLGVGIGFGIWGDRWEPHDGKAQPEKQKSVRTVTDRATTVNTPPAPTAVEGQSPESNAEEVTAPSSALDATVPVQNQGQSNNKQGSGSTIAGPKKEITRVSTNKKDQQGSRQKVVLKKKEKTINSGQGAASSTTKPSEAPPQQPPPAASSNPEMPAPPPVGAGPDNH